jgi:hypothetical protein
MWTMLVGLGDPEECPETLSWSEDQLRRPLVTFLFTGIGWPRLEHGYQAQLDHGYSQVTTELGGFRKFTGTSLSWLRWIMDLHRYKLAQPDPGYSQVEAGSWIFTGLGWLCWIMDIHRSLTSCYIQSRSKMWALCFSSDYNVWLT